MIQVVALKVGSPLRFKGVEQQQKYYEWLSQFPEKSLKRVLHVKERERNEGIAHILLAIFYGRIDQHVPSLNTEIVSLLQARKKAKKQQNQSAYDQAAEKLADLREAIARAIAPLQRAKQKQ